LNDLRFQFEWDEAKAGTNFRKHGISFRLASSVFSDPAVFTTADLVHSETEERWFSVGLAQNGVVLSVAHLWSILESGLVKVRIITARRSTANELRYYLESK
jgi:uncharacterized protein